MEKLHSPFRIIETKKKRIFFLKLFIYLAFMFGGKFSPIFQDFLTNYPGMSSLHTAILFLLGGNILISLASSLQQEFVIKLKMKRFTATLLGISWFPIY